MKNNSNANELNANDLELLKSMDINEDEILEQLEMFKKGAAPVRLEKAATRGDGIKVFTRDETNQLVSLFATERDAFTIIKFVPASGAASRMFKTLLHFNNSLLEINEPVIEKRAQVGEKDCDVLLEVMKGLKDKKFAFHDDLELAMKNGGLDMENLMSNGQFKPVLDYLLTEKGLNYAKCPKALIKFHRYDTLCRTALEEHLVEGIAYSKDKDNRVHLHFTISPEHREKFIQYIDSIIHHYQTDGVTFDIQYSEQKPHTDRIAVDEANNLFRDENDNLFLRPGGHGALIENLDEIDCDILYIKNIDNVVPDRLKKETVTYKKMLGGYLIKLQTEIFLFLKQIAEGAVNENDLARMEQYCRDVLSVDFPSGFDKWDIEKKVAVLKQKLNRPIRVCGMVRNQGEPGGGPFFVRGGDGTVSLQIVESAQIDTNSPDQLGILQEATHFNPVDLVCGVRDFDGKPFDLLKYVDHDAYFIAHKSHHGRFLKALELPGLWNGAMADWITVFVEVPIITFNPIKTINDLLRDQHQ